MSRPSIEPDVPESRRDVEVALAEFAALRSEIVVTRQIQAGTVGIGLTAVGLFFGFALQETGDRRLLIAVPFAGLIITLLHLSESYNMSRQGTYIRTLLWPYLRKHSRFPHSWEQWKVDQRADRTRTLVAAFLFNFAVPVMFAGCGAAALALYDGGMGIEVVAGGAAVLLTLVVPPFVGRSIGRPH